MLRSVAPIALAVAAFAALTGCRTAIPRSCPASAASDAVLVADGAPAPEPPPDAPPPVAPAPPPAVVPYGAPPPCGCAPPPCEIVDPCARERIAIGSWARAWWARPCGSTSITLGGEPDTASDVSVCGDLELDSEVQPLVGIDVTWRRHRLRVSYEPLSFSGRATADQEFVFHGQTYAAGDRIDSDLDLTFWRVEWDYRLLGDSRCGFLRAGVGAEIWTLRERIEDETQGFADSREFTHALPVASVSGEKRWGRFGVGGLARVGFLDSDRSQVDLEASASVAIGLGLRAEVGWRWTRFSFVESTNSGCLTFSGPFVGLSSDF
jgi:hypothetical protein